MNFSDLGVDADLVQSLSDDGITSPFPIQEQTIPLAMSGQDIIGQAKTGTGKTFGFGLPLIQRLGPDPEHGVQALVVVPTRELCVQVFQDLELAARNRPTMVVPIYGGKAYEGQIDQLKQGAQIVVGTPGRLLDLAQQRILNLGNVSEMVLDEADKMLDLGFLPDIEKLFARTPETRHTMLFSATMPGQIVTLARRFMRKPIHIRAQAPDESITQANIRHLVYRAHSLDKDELIARTLQANGRGKTVVFTRTKRGAARLMEELRDRGFAAAAVHGDLSQEAREKAMSAFKAGKRDVLIATDVAARGIDVDDVTHVINHTIPDDEESYLHRVGRTGRAGNTGIAVTLVDWDDLTRWGLISRALELGQDEPPETYSSSAHLYSDLDIPEGTKGRLPRTARVAAESGARPETGSDGDRSGPDASRGADRPARRRRRGSGDIGSSGSGSGGGGSRGTGSGGSGTGASSRAESGDTRSASVDGAAGESSNGTGEGGDAAPRRRRRRRSRSGGNGGSAAAESQA
ncbi:hypothetical protein GCM10011490_07380 [Pseudoclavibacter endophyticus]|uniref:RNA helicase n=1 Tax=Pseudoclavibacter endophyticus TaxID=1778590 RepID=A0A6H9WUC0_9MICO|nr:DEAD/DEAH box helicase [Pseudoclavibacter endophyticus]KAB1649780.1 DEAD/DEAH box helicase [Pseudoclavibacter endophyticus]GGA59799.1 hypothetical protein GCM10011490_07380 [Pseudoclavibacter endophyticus]